MIHFGHVPCPTRAGSVLRPSLPPLSSRPHFVSGSSGPCGALGYVPPLRVGNCASWVGAAPLLAALAFPPALRVGLQRTPGGVLGGAVYRLRRTTNRIPFDVSVVYFAGAKQTTETSIRRERRHGNPVGRTFRTTARGFAPHRAIPPALRFATASRGGYSTAPPSRPRPAPGALPPGELFARTSLRDSTRAKTHRLPPTRPRPGLGNTAARAAFNRG